MNRYRNGDRNLASPIDSMTASIPLQITQRFIIKPAVNLQTFFDLQSHYCF
jgi:hypothetical protein